MVGHRQTDPADLGDVLQVQQGLLYPALHRLEQQGWISASWQETNSDARPRSTG